MDPPPPPFSPKTGDSLNFTITGQGQCGEFAIDWGDDTPQQHVTGHDFQSPFHATHQYDGWGGGKTVTVTPVASCGGYARTRFKIDPTAPVTLGWNRRPTDPVAMDPILDCNHVPNVARLASHSLLHVMGDPSPVFNFSCSFNGCIYDPDGRPGSVAAAPFPFPGMREYSLVVRVQTNTMGSQLFQGGKNVNITVPVGGKLQVCQNTDNPGGAVGGWGLSFAVDQLGP